MLRLTHSVSGLRRKMQMSAKTIFVCVEGLLDRHVFDRLATEVLPPDSFEIVASQDLPADLGSGKGALLSLYRRYRRSSELNHEFLGKRTYCLFFLDKDVDDLLGKCARSAHVIYTLSYEIENHLFVDGDLTGALRAAGLITQVEAERVFDGDVATWRQSSARRWADWIALCVCALRLDLDCGATFSRSSPINTDVHGEVDEQLKLEQEKRLFETSGLSQHDFDETLAWARRIVWRRIDQDRHDSVFRGKWYPTFLRASCSKQRALSKRAQNTLDDSVMAALLQGLRLTGSWIEKHRDALARGAAACGLAAHPQRQEVAGQGA